MHSFFRAAGGASLAAALVTVGTAARAVPPRLRLVPSANTGFLVDQRMDVRGEATLDAGRTLSTIALAVDGQVVPFSAQLFVDLSGTRSITLRRFSFQAPGVHTLSVTATDSAGETNTITQQYAVINPVGSRRPVKNLIILLGDGMGAGHKTAARIVRYGLNEGRVGGRLALDDMPNISSILTHSLNNMVTDSSPGMQNYVTGSKSNNNQEGVYPDNTTAAFDNPRIEYLGEYLARNFGKSLGIVTTADIEDATPAANMIHTQDRNAGTGICDQYFDERANSNLRVLMGGGRRWFTPVGTVGSARSNSTDYQLDAETATALGVAQGALDPSRNLLQDFINDGYAFAGTRTALAAVPFNTTKLIGLFAYGNMNVALDKVNGRRGITPVISGTARATTVVQDYQLPDQPLLDEMANTALTVLNNGNQNGFVLMIEGAHIDKQSHGMDSDRAIYDMMEFDNAIRRAIDFAQRDGNTLVIVTSDHECSGFSIISGVNTANAASATSDAAILNPANQPARQTSSILVGGFPNYGTMYSPNNTTTPDPLGYPLSPDPTVKIGVGFGASADRYEDWLAKPVPFNDGIATTAIAAGTLTNPPYTAVLSARLPEANRGMYLRGQLTGQGTAQAGHTANEIQLHAFSSGSRASTLFGGMLDNTDVFFLLARSLMGNY